MGEVVRFSGPEEEEAPKAQRPSADVRIIPTIDISALKGADPLSAARALLPILARTIYTPAAVDRMVKGYSMATRAAIDRLRAEAEGG